MEKELNKEQKRAIGHRTGPLLVVAGAGTGKTTVITERIKYLIFKGLCEPQEILALTFTEKAAGEMEERVDLAMPYGYTSMWISTFHSFCDRILRDEIYQIGYDSGYKLLTQGQAGVFMKNNLFEFDLDYFRPLGNPEKFISGMLAHFSRLADEDVDPSQYLSWVKSKFKTLNTKHLKQEELEVKRYQELAKAYQKYEEIKIKNSYLDFSDLITKTLKLFRERPNVLQEYRERFKFILVDEFQDTNYAQNELVKLLAGKRANVTVVGDDDQSVYRFRGAAVSNIMQFRKVFPKAKVVVLTQNYRSTQEILDAAYRLIQNNNPDRLEISEQINKKLIGIKKGGVMPVLIHEKTANDEYQRVAEEIISLNEAGTAWKEIAILVRANNHADGFCKALAQLEIPFQFLGPEKLYSQTEIIDLISYLKVLNDVGDSVSLMRVLSIPILGIKAGDLAVLGAKARHNNQFLYEVLNDKRLKLSATSKKKIKEIVKLINRHLGEMRDKKPGELLYDFMVKTKYLEQVLNPDDIEASKRAENIALFFDKVKAFEEGLSEPGVTSLVDYLIMAQETGESPRAAEINWNEQDSVKLLTVHSSKGLEFKVVFMVNLVDLRFPQSNRREMIEIPVELIREILPSGDYHLQEERRLFYVGMTRAKERLFFTGADFYNTEGRKKKLSNFVYEALGEEISAAEHIIHTQSFNQFKPVIKNHAKKEPVHVHYLSYSQMESFKVCPLHYKLLYILKVPTPPSPSLSFGSSIHSALNDFYIGVKKGKRGSIKNLYKEYEKNWINAGYSDKRHEQAMKEKGYDILKKFWKNDFDSTNFPIALEQNFNLALTQGKQFVKVGGKIDRVDKLGEMIEIIDYKTGPNVLSQREVDKNEQLSIYALAASRIKELPFNREINKLKLSLYFIEEGVKISTTRTKKDLEKIEKEIFKIKEEIEKSDFKCSNHYFCQMGCVFSDFCRAN